MAVVDRVQHSPPAQGLDTVQIAGACERNARQLRERNCIEIDRTIWQKIQEAVTKIGVML
jgi:LDH2 family malate/lactate/ureidoglycolate dehydrogenase